MRAALRGVRWIGLLAAVVLAAPGRAAAVTVNASPGDTGSIQSPVWVNPASTDPAKGVQIKASGPAWFVVLSSSTLGPTDIQPGTTQTFVVNYQIHPDAPYDAFVATLTPTASMFNVVPRWDLQASSVTFMVQPALRTGQAVSADASGNVWEVLGSTAQYGVTKYTSAGVFASSVSIPNASRYGSWSLRFDGSGNAWAVGTSSGPQTVKNDAAVYKVSSAGSVLLASSTWNGALNGDDIAFGAADGIWIAGMVPNASNGTSMALLSVSTQTGLISLSTTYTGAGGVDMGSGVALDSSGNIWVVGFSSNPNTQGANKLDLALWKFNSTGSSLTAGPFLRPGYMWNPNARVWARIIASSSTLIVSASRLNTLSNTDLAVLTFDFNGTLLSTKAWHGASGGDQTPLGMALDSSGKLLVVGNSSGTLGFWTYSSTGGFVSAETLASVGIAQGIAVSSSDVWLALDKSTFPHRWTGGTALAGAEGIGGGVGALRIGPAPQPSSLADFYHRDVYAFPNPSRGNRGVTIRTQVGLADSISIRIYDISGQLVHEGSPGDPRVFDDGNGKGPQYTYDYAWDTGRVGSGVYIYAVTAKKSGHSDIKRIKKAAVIK